MFENIGEYDDGVIRKLLRKDKEFYYMKGFTIEEISVGQSAEMAKTVSEADVYSFAGITGDFTPQTVSKVIDKNG